MKKKYIAPQTRGIKMDSPMFSAGSGNIDPFAKPSGRSGAFNGYAGNPNSNLQSL